MGTSHIKMTPLFVIFLILINVYAVSSMASDDHSSSPSAHSPSSSAPSHKNEEAHHSTTQGHHESNNGQAQDMEVIHQNHYHHNSVKKSWAGGGVILGGLATTFFVSIVCYIRATRRKHVRVEAGTKNEDHPSAIV
ncbi:hypothetical protein Leryth_011666 [Lithospermum erythrorhizon]|nr:hypothetical protein Leryth_011666 [Lithospermum erythrorhizon]